MAFAIYTRQSNEPKDGLSSCAAQFELCMAAAHRESGPSAQWIGERFDDEGVSGRSLDRPALNRLRERVQTGAVDCVVAAALDRWSRSLSDTTILFEEFERAGVRVHVVNIPDMGGGPESRLLRHILASFAQFERELIVSRIAETRAYLKKHGRRLAGPAPYGYDADPATKQLVPDRTEARRVRAMFRRAANGQTPSEIARCVDHLGWRTKRWRSKRTGNHVGGGRWTARQVLTLLRNPVCIGKFADGARARDGCHAAIVELGLFRSVQNLLDQRRPPAQRSRQPLDFPLRGKIVCPKCRRRLCTYTVTHRKGQATIGYRYYRCRSTADGRGRCRGVQYPAHEVEQVICDLLAEDEQVWATLPESSPQGFEGGPAALRGIWSGLDSAARRSLLPRIIESVEFRRRNTGMRVTFAQGFLDAFSGRFPALPTSVSKPAGGP